MEKNSWGKKKKVTQYSIEVLLINCPWNYFSICPQNCKELPDISWSAADLAPEHGRETHEEEVLHRGRHVPCTRGGLSGRVSEHAGGPQLPACGQRQLSGEGKFRFSFRAVSPPFVSLLHGGMWTDRGILVTTGGRRMGATGFQKGETKECWRTFYSG
jgi:hypothetical protein